MEIVIKNDNSKLVQEKIKFQLNNHVEVVKDSKVETDLNNELAEPTGTGGRAGHAA